MRLDKYLANMGMGTRTEVKKILKSGKITVDGAIVTAPECRIEPEMNEIKMNGRVLTYQKHIYLMLNKPSGVISATEDKNKKTVIDLLEGEYKNRVIFPVGRLDKDTVGLVILTNDGQFAHNTLSPNKHIEKTYYSVVTGDLKYGIINTFNEGVVLEDGYRCKPANLEIINRDEERAEVLVTISEGKYHQIKRMFKSVGCRVVYLKRVKFGEITLDESLKEGEYRELDDKEMQYIRKYIGK